MQLKLGGDRPAMAQCCGEAIIAAVFRIGCIEPPAPGHWQDQRKAPLHFAIGAHGVVQPARKAESLVKDGPGALLAVQRRTDRGAEEEDNRDSRCQRPDMTSKRGDA